MTARRALALAMLTVPAMLVACGVPDQDSPTLLESQPSATTPARSQPTNPPGDGSTLTATVEFVRSDRLVGVRRVLPASAGARAPATLDALTAGPSDAEQARGLSTALPPDLRLSVESDRSGVITVAISGETSDRSSTETVLAVAQIVLSLTSLPGVRAVQFTRDGKPAETLLADGALTSRPLTAADYASLRSR